VPSIENGLLPALNALPAVKEASLAEQPAPPPPAEGEDVEAIERSQTFANPVVRILAQHNQTALINVLSYLNDHDVPVLSLEILEPNLESVFLHLTGKKLRE
jgi:ABC-2 type transport system ATP-binding protein